MQGGIDTALLAMLGCDTAIQIDNRIEHTGQRLAEERFRPLAPDRITTDYRLV
jgi:hypothetical protein